RRQYESRPAKVAPFVRSGSGDGINRVGSQHRDAKCRQQMKFHGITHKAQLRDEIAEPGVKMAVIPQAEHQRNAHYRRKQPHPSASHLPAGRQGESEDAYAEVVRGSPVLLKLKINLLYALIRTEKRHEQIEQNWTSSYRSEEHTSE